MFFTAGSVPALLPNSTVNSLFWLGRHAFGDKHQSVISILNGSSNFD